MHLSTVDRLVKKLGPVNTLIENLCERLLPNQVAHASGFGPCECMPDNACIHSPSGIPYGYYCISGVTNDYEFMSCSC